MDSEKLSNGRLAHVKCIKSEKFAAGRSHDQKLIDGIMAALSFDAGVRWTLGYIRKELKAGADIDDLLSEQE